MKCDMIVEIMLVLLGVLDIILLARSLKVSLYRFQNIEYIACLPAVLLLVIRLATGDAGTCRELLQLLASYPGFFAQISVAAFAMLFVLMAVSNLELMRREGMAIKNMVGSLFQFLFIFSTAAVYVLMRLLSRWIGGSGSGVLHYLGSFLPILLYSLIAYCECITIGIMVLGYLAAKARPAYDKDYIIIPGCSIRKDGGLLPLLRGRVNQAVRFAWDQERATGKPVHYVPSGGQGKDEIMSEGSAMELYLLSHGAEPQEVFPEKNSPNTYRNFLYSKELIEGLKPGARVAFATTNYHVLRCGLIARVLGMPAEGIGSSTRWYFWPNGFAREVVAIFAMSKRLHMKAAAGILLLSAVLALAV